MWQVTKQNVKAPDPLVGGSTDVSVSSGTAIIVYGMHNVKQSTNHNLPVCYKNITRSRRERRDEMHNAVYCIGHKDREWYDDMPWRQVCVSPGADRV